MKQPGLHGVCGPLSSCIAVWLTLSSVVWAETGGVQIFPAPRTKMRNSLTVEVDTRGVVSNGYRGIRLKLSNTPLRNKPPVPVTADRRFRVVLEPSGIGHLAGVATTQIIEIPENQSTAEAIVAIPSSGDWYQLQLSVYEGGDKLIDVSGTIMPGFWGMRSDAESLPTLLFIDYDVPDRAARDRMIGVVPGANDTKNLPDFSQLVTNIPYSNMGMATIATPAAAGGTPSVRLSDSQIVTQAAQNSRLQLLSPAEMSPRWLDFSCYDIAFISRADLAKMARQNPAQLRALVDWLHGGPALVVYGAGDDFAHLAEIERLLDLAPLPASKQAGGRRGWTMDDRSKPFTADATANEPLPLVSRRAGFGWVAAMSSEDPFPGTQNNWLRVLEIIPLGHQHWMVRHGLSYQSYNSGIWNWYIPGVGAAPVFSFLLLATLFAIVIGPVNYLFLGRIQRLYLLLVTVPAGAAIVTLALFTYAVLSDGLGVKTRVRSVSLLDQSSGRMASWSRQSYYASLVPSQGLKYPADAAVWLLEEEPQVNRQGGPWYQFVWEEDGGQRLRSGYLSSRRLTQFIVIRSGKSTSKLTVSGGTSGGAPQVTSALASEIRQLVLRDADGNYYQALSPLKPGASATLQLLSASDAQKLISKIAEDHQPTFPVGYDPVAEERRATSPWGRMYWPGSSSSPSLSSSILESKLFDLRMAASEVLEPRSYLAVLESNPEVPIGLAEAKEAESFHVLLGRW